MKCTYCDNDNVNGRAVCWFCGKDLGKQGQPTEKLQTPQNTNKKAMAWLTIFPLSAALIIALPIVFKDNVPTIPINPEMIFIEKGCFTMGSPGLEQGRSRDERQHKVCLKGFYMGKYEVTFDEYDRFAHATGRPLPKDDGFGRGRYPVFRVSWEDAYRYAQWLSAKTGQHYRLPTEAEWEYAARAGSEAPAPGEGGFQQACLFLNHIKCPGALKHVAPVGQYQSNPWGLHDMLGNVVELTASAYDVGYSGGELKGATPDDKSVRIMRGGSWAHVLSSLRFANRDKVAVDMTHNLLGFRLVRD